MPDRFCPQKNLEMLHPRAGDGHGARAPAVAFLCGDGTHERETDRAHRKARARGARVRFVGYVADVWGWMRRADVFVSVSHFEGHPNTVLEAAGVRVSARSLRYPRTPRDARRTPKRLFVDRTSPMAIAEVSRECPV